MAKLVILIVSFFTVMFVGQFFGSSIPMEPKDKEYNTDSTLCAYGRWSKQIDSCNYQLVIRIKTIN